MAPCIAMLMLDWAVFCASSVSHPSACRLGGAEQRYLVLPQRTPHWCATALPFPPIFTQPPCLAAWRLGRSIMQRTPPCPSFPMPGPQGLGMAPTPIPASTLTRNPKPLMSLPGHVPPCTTLYHLVPPCTTLHHLVSPCTTLCHGSRQWVGLLLCLVRQPLLLPACGPVRGIRLLVLEHRTPSKACVGGGGREHWSCGRGAGAGTPEARHALNLQHRGEHQPTQQQAS